MFFKVMLLISCWHIYNFTGSLKASEHYRNEEKDFQDDIHINEQPRINGTHTFNEGFNISGQERNHGGQTDKGNVTKGAANESLLMELNQEKHKNPSDMTEEELVKYFEEIGQRFYGHPLSWRAIKHMAALFGLVFLLVAISRCIVYAEKRGERLRHTDLSAKHENL